MNVSLLTLVASYYGDRIDPDPPQPTPQPTAACSNIAAAAPTTTKAAASPSAFITSNLFFRYFPPRPQATPPPPPSAAAAVLQDSPHTENVEEAENSLRSPQPEDRVNVTAPQHDAPGVAATGPVKTPAASSLPAALPSHAMNRSSTLSSPSPPPPSTTARAAAVPPPVVVASTSLLHPIPLAFSAAHPTARLAVECSPAGYGGGGLRVWHRPLCHPPSRRRRRAFLLRTRLSRATTATQSADAGAAGPKTSARRREGCCEASSAQIPKGVDQLEAEKRRRTFPSAHRGGCHTSGGDAASTRSSSCASSSSFSSASAFSSSSTSDVSEGACDVHPPGPLSFSRAACQPPRPSAKQKAQKATRSKTLSANSPPAAAVTPRDKVPQQVRRETDVRVASGHPREREEEPCALPTTTKIVVILQLYDWDAAPPTPRSASPWPPSNNHPLYQDVRDRNFVKTRRTRSDGETKNGTDVGEAGTLWQLLGPSLWWFERSVRPASAFDVPAAVRASASTSLSSAREEVGSGADSNEDAFCSRPYPTNAHELPNSNLPLAQPAVEGLASDEGVAALRVLARQSSQEKGSARENYSLCGSSTLADTDIAAATTPKLSCALRLFVSPWAMPRRRRHITIPSVQKGESPYAADHDDGKHQNEAYEVSAPSSFSASPFKLSAHLHKDSDVHCGGNALNTVHVASLSDRPILSPHCRWCPHAVVELGLCGPSSDAPTLFSAAAFLATLARSDSATPSESGSSSSSICTDSDNDSDTDRDYSSGNHCNRQHHHCHCMRRHCSCHKKTSRERDGVQKASLVMFSPPEAEALKRRRRRQRQRHGGGGGGGGGVVPAFGRFPTPHVPSGPQWPGGGGGRRGVATWRTPACATLPVNLSYASTSASGGRAVTSSPPQTEPTQSAPARSAAAGAAEAAYAASQRWVRRPLLELLSLDSVWSPRMLEGDDDTDGGSSDSSSAEGGGGDVSFTDDNSKGKIPTTRAEVAFIGGGRGRGAGVSQAVETQEELLTSLLCVPCMAPNPPLLPLHTLDLSFRTDVRQLEDVLSRWAATGHLGRLARLSVMGCIQLRHLNWLADMPAATLVVLNVCGCEELRDLHRVRRLANLRVLKATQLMQLERLGWWWGWEEEEEKKKEDAEHQGGSYAQAGQLDVQSGVGAGEFSAAGARSMDQNARSLQQRSLAPSSSSSFCQLNELAELDLACFRRRTNCLVDLDWIGELPSLRKLALSVSEEEDPVRQPQWHAQTRSRAHEQQHGEHPSSQQNAEGAAAASLLDMTRLAWLASCAELRELRLAFRDGPRAILAAAELHPPPAPPLPLLHAATSAFVAVAGGRHDAPLADLRDLTVLALHPFPHLRVLELTKAILTERFTNWLAVGCPRLRDVELISCTVRCTSAGLRAAQQQQQQRPRRSAFSSEFVHRMRSSPYRHQRFQGVENANARARGATLTSAVPPPLLSMHIHPHAQPRLRANLHHDDDDDLQQRRNDEQWWWGQLSQLPHLCRLSVYDLEGLTNGSSLDWVVDCARLRHLALRKCRWLLDAYAAHRLPRLRTLNLNATGIDDLTFLRMRHGTLVQEGPLIAAAAAAAAAQVPLCVAQRSEGLTTPATRPVASDSPPSAVTTTAAAAAATSRESVGGALSPVVAALRDYPRHLQRLLRSATSSPTDTNAHPDSGNTGNDHHDQGRATGSFQMLPPPQQRRLLHPPTLSRLTELVLVDCPFLSDLTPLSYLTACRSLLASDHAVTSLTHLSTCVSLERLYLINYTKLTDIAALRWLRRLRVVYITHSAIRDVSWVAQPVTPAMARQWRRAAMADTHHGNGHSASTQPGMTFAGGSLYQELDSSTSDERRSEDDDDAVVDGVNEHARACADPPRAQSHSSPQQRTGDRLRRRAHRRRVPSALWESEDAAWQVLPRLEVLILAYSKSLTDVSALGALPRLRYLDLRDCVRLHQLGAPRRSPSRKTVPLFPTAPFTMTTSAVSAAAGAGGTGSRLCSPASPAHTPSYVSNTPLYRLSSSPHSAPPQQGHIDQLVGGEAGGEAARRGAAASSEWAVRHFTTVPLAWVRQAIAHVRQHLRTWRTHAASGWVAAAAAAPRNRHAPTATAVHRDTRNKAHDNNTRSSSFAFAAPAAPAVASSPSGIILTAETGHPGTEAASSANRLVGSPRADAPGAPAPPPRVQHVIGVTPTASRALPSREPRSLAQLAPTLRYVSLSNCKALVDAAALGSLSRLQYLHAAFTGIRDVRWVRGCTSLKVLDLTMSPCCTPGAPSAAAAVALLARLPDELMELEIVNSRPVEREY